MSPIVSNTIAASTIDTQTRSSTPGDLPSSAAKQDKNGTSEPFHWPLRDVEFEKSSSPAAPWREKPTRSTSHTNRAPAWLRSLEKCWLSPTALPLAHRARQARWRPDPPAAYCDLCGMSIGPYEADEFGCSQCRGKGLPWERFVRLGEYDGVLAQWIKDAKFHGQRRLAFDMGRSLGLAVRHAGAPIDGLAVAPVGMAALRRLARGYDQAAEIARGVARELSCPLVHSFRRQRRPSQRSVPTSQRRKNIAGSFSFRAGVDFTGWSVLIVDDVRTSGATLTQACRTLKAEKQRKPAEIWIAVLAVTPAHDRSRAVSRGSQIVETELWTGRMQRDCESSQMTPLDRPADIGTVPIPVDE